MGSPTAQVQRGTSFRPAQQRAGMDSKHTHCRHECCPHRLPKEGRPSLLVSPQLAQLVPAPPPFEHAPSAPGGELWLGPAAALSLCTPPAAAAAAAGWAGEGGPGVGTEDEAGDWAPAGDPREMVGGVRLGAASDSKRWISSSPAQLTVSDCEACMICAHGVRGAGACGCAAAWCHRTQHNPSQPRFWAPAGQCAGRRREAARARVAAQLPFLAGSTSTPSPPRPPRTCRMLGATRSQYSDSAPFSSSISAPSGRAASAASAAGCTPPHPVGGGVP